MQEEQEQTNYFASMTDLLVGFLFVFVIMVAYFAYQVKDDTDNTVPKRLYEQVVEKNKILTTENEALKKENAELKKRLAELEKELKELKAILAKLKVMSQLDEYLSAAQGERDNLVKEIVDELVSSNIKAKIGRSNNVITISGEDLFASGRSDLESREKANERVDAIGEILLKKIQCHTFVGQEPFFTGEKLNECNPKRMFVEAVFIEGHTDDQPVSSVLVDGSRNNLELSSRRATNTYQRIVNTRPYITKLKNPDGEQVLSVAAYGEQRPMVPNTSKRNRARNRRIDILIDMHAPKNVSELNALKQRYGD